MSSSHYTLFNNSFSSRLQAPCPHSEPEMAAAAQSLLWGGTGKLTAAEIWKKERVPSLRVYVAQGPLVPVKGFQSGLMSGSQADKATFLGEGARQKGLHPAPWSAYTGSTPCPGRAFVGYLPNGHPRASVP